MLRTDLVRVGKKEPTVGGVITIFLSEIWLCSSLPTILSLFPLEKMTIVCIHKITQNSMVGIC